MAMTRLPIVVLAALLAGVTAGLLAGARRAPAGPAIGQTVGPPPGAVRQSGPVSDSRAETENLRSSPTPGVDRPAALEWMAGLAAIPQGSDAEALFAAEFHRRFPGLRAEWFRNPDAFLQLFRDPANAGQLPALTLALRVLIPAADGRQVMEVSMAKAYPRPLLEGLAGFLRTGTPAQKEAVLRFLEGVEVQPEYVGSPVADLLTDADPAIRARALKIVAREGHPVPEHGRAILLKDLEAAPPGGAERLRLLEVLSYVVSPQADRDLAGLVDRGATDTEELVLAECLAKRLGRGAEQGGAPFGAGIGPAAADDYFLSIQHALAAPRTDAAVLLKYLQAAVAISPQRAAPLIEAAMSTIGDGYEQGMTRVLEAIGQGRPHGEIVRLTARYW